MAGEETRRIGGFAYFIVGFLFGIVLTGFIVTFSMPRMMLETWQSNRDFESTVAVIESSAKQKGWKVPKVYDLRQSLILAGQSDVGRANVISVCRPESAYEILKTDANKRITAMMPCRLGVYENEKGEVFISTMNISLMSKMFGGDIEKQMGIVAEEQDEILKPLIE